MLWFLTEYHSKPVITLSHGVKFDDIPHIDEDSQQLTDIMYTCTRIMVRMDNYLKYHCSECEAKHVRSQHEYYSNSLEALSRK